MDQLMHTLKYCPVANRRVGYPAVSGHRCRHCGTILPPMGDETPVAQPEEPEPQAEFIVSTTDTIPTMTITSHQGVAISKFVPIMDSQELALAGAMTNLQNQVLAMGANAMIGLRISNSSRLIIAYGTAVTVVPDSDTAKEGQEQESP